MYYLAGTGAEFQMNEPMRSFDDRSHMRTAGQPRAATPDPLAELARLVSQDDPFRDIFGDAKRAVEPPATPTDDTSWLEAALRPSYPTAESEPPTAAEPLPAFGYGEPQHAAFAPADEPEHELGPDISLRKRSGGVLAAGTLLGLAVIGGIGLFAFRDGMSGDAAPGTPPLIRAEPGPNKTIPVAAEAADTPQHNKLIYDRVGGVEPKANGKVMSRVEEPVELPPAEPRDAGRGAASAPVAAAASPEPALRGGAPEQTGTAPGSEPRRVRTVLIKPDDLGSEPTLAAPSQSAAPAPAASPAAPAAAAVGNPAPAFERPKGYPFSIVEEEPAEIRPPAPAAPSTSAAASTGPVPAPTPKPAAPATSVVRTIAPAEPPRAAAAPQQPARPAPAPQAQTRVAALPPAAPPAPAAASGGSRFAVQLTSQRSEQEARTAYAGLQRRFGSLLAPYQPSIQKADLGSRGIFYRVRVAASSREDAVKLCTNLKAQGGDCVVQAN
jgi:hypothetical protein